LQIMEYPKVMYMPHTITFLGILTLVISSAFYIFIPMPQMAK